MGYDTNKVSIGSLAEFARGGANTMEQIFNQIYPVGSIYTTTDSAFDPNVSFGGTWEQIESGRFLMSKNKGSGQVGQYQTAKLPNHKHTGSGTVSGVWTSGNTMVNGTGGVPCVTMNSSASFSFTTSNTTSLDTSKVEISAESELRPPSYTVIFWKRTA